MNLVEKDKIYVDFFAGHLKSCNSESHPVHFHEHIEIYFLISGSNECLINNKFYKVNEGDILIFKPNQIHRILRNDNEIFERYILEVSPRFLADNLIREEYFFVNNFLNNNEAIIFSPNKKEKKEIMHLFSKYEKANHQDPDPTLFHSSLRCIRILEIFTYIFTIIQNYNKPEQKPLKTNSLVSPILDYLEKNYINTSLSSLAEHFNINKQYLCVLFKKNMSMTINKYILSKKIIYAKKLLAEGKNITQVAELCGFNDTTDFARVFRKYVNLSPKKYQSNLKIWK